MKKKLLSTLLLAGTLLIGSTVSAYAQDVSSDPLQPYEDRCRQTGRLPEMPRYQKRKKSNDRCNQKGICNDFQRCL